MEVGNDGESVINSSDKQNYGSMGVRTILVLLTTGSEMPMRLPSTQLTYHEYFWINN